MFLPSEDDRGKGDTFLQQLQYCQQRPPDGLRRAEGFVSGDTHAMRRRRCTAMIRLRAVLSRQCPILCIVARWHSVQDRS